MRPFKCPHCGSHEYAIVLTGCKITNATLQEAFSWDEKANEYSSSGTLLVESDEIEPQDSQALCIGCEKDVTEAVSAFEASLESSGESAGA